MFFSRKFFLIGIIGLFTQHALLGMQAPLQVALTEHDQKYYTTYLELAQEILKDYYKNQSNTLNPKILLKIAQFHNKIFPLSNGVLQKSDAQALSLLGSGNDNLLMVINKKSDNTLRTQTYTGILQLAATLTNPNKFLEGALNRQAELKELAANNHLRTRIQNTIRSKITPAHETHIFQLFGQQHNELPEAQRRHYFQNQILSHFDTSPSALTTSIMLNKIWYWFFSIIQGIVTVPLIGKIDPLLKNPHQVTSILKETAVEMKERGAMFLESIYFSVNIYAMLKLIKKIKNEEGKFAACTNTIAMYLQIFHLINGFIANKRYVQYYEPGQQEIETSIKVISDIMDVIEELIEIPSESLQPQIQAIRDWFKNSVEYRFLHTELSKLKSEKITDRLNRPGQLLALHKIIFNNKNLFEVFIKNVLRLIGFFDAKCALAEYIGQHVNNAEKPISFVTFNNKLHINLKNSWAPIFTGAHPVLNSIELGGNSPRNMLLIAPNSSGKSSLMKTVMLNALTAQIAGFVTAQAGSSMPCFDLLSCYMNVKEDPSAGLSTGAAQAAGLQEMKRNIAQGHAHKLIIIDEPLSGTPEWLAQKFICTDADHNPSLLTLLDLKPNVLSIIATHFKSINVEDKKSFGLYHMKIEKNEDNIMFCPSYELVPGDHPWWFNESSTAQTMRAIFAQWYLAKMHGN